MWAKSKSEHQAKVNSLFRIEDIWRLQTFRTIQTNDLTNKYGLSLNVNSEENKFLQYVCCSNKLPYMERTKSDLLLTTILDTYLTANNEKEHVVLATLRDAFLRPHP